MQGTGHRVHLPLDRDGHLRRAKSPERAGEGVVGIDAVAVDLDRGEVVWAQAVLRRQRQHGRAMRSVCAGVGDQLDLGCDQPAVGGAGRPVPHVEGMALESRQKALIPVEHDAAGPLGQQRHQRQVGLDGGLVLAAERAARHGHDHPHVLVPQSQRPGDLSLGALGSLAARPHGEPSILPVERDPRLRLQERVRLPAGEVLVLQHDIGPLKCGRQIATSEVQRADQVSVDVHPWRARRHRGARIADHRQRLVCDPDQVPGPVCGLVRFGRYDRHRIPHVAHLVLAQDRHVLEHAAHPVAAGDVLGGEHSHDAIHPLGRAGVDGQNAGVGPMCPQHAQPQHPLHHKIGWKNVSTARLGPAVDPGHRPADTRNCR